jgi:hypothetical protein
LLAQQGARFKVVGAAVDAWLSLSLRSGRYGFGQCFVKESRAVKTPCAALNRQLDARSLVLNTVTLIYATLVEAAVARPPLSEGEIFTENRQANFAQGSQKSF